MTIVSISCIFGRHVPDYFFWNPVEAVFLPDIRSDIWLEPELETDSVMYFNILNFYECTIITLHVCSHIYVVWWHCGRALDLRFTGRRFNSQPVCFYVT